MIELLNMTAVAKQCTPVTSSEYTVGVKSNELHPEGLFSEVIFGAKESIERKKSVSYINLNCRILHPALIKPIYRINSKILHILQRKKFYKFEGDSLVEDENGEMNGITSVIQNFSKLIDRSESSQIRIDIHNMLTHYHKKDMVFIDKCIVIPAYYRDVQTEESGGKGLRIPPINEYYQKIIKLSLQIQSLSMDPGSPIYEIHASKMFTLISDLYDYLVSKVSKKQGMVRKDILGKRVDFSGRAVIIGGADEIRADEIGVPYNMLVKLFEPFIVYELFNSGHYDKQVLAAHMLGYNNSSLSVMTIRQLLNDINKGHELTKEFDSIVRSAVQTAITGKVVIAKRDPSLHAESVEGFKPVIVDGQAIKLSPPCAAAYNADFDGDQMCLYVPITNESIEEVKTKMISSQSSDAMGMIKDDLSKDYTIGLYQLTKNSIHFKNMNAVVINNVNQLKTLHPNQPIIIDGEITTVGRNMFNSVLPDVKYRVSKPVDKKTINKLMSKISSDYESSPKVYFDFVQKIVELGGKYYTLMPSTFGIEDLEVPPAILKLKEQLSSVDPSQSGIIIKKMEDMLKKYLEENEINLGVVGAAGGLKNGYSQLRQILICKGLVQGPNNTIGMVPESYASGMKEYDFFQSGFASRTGIIDRVLNTSDTGYLSRRLVYALQRVEADPSINDCGTKRFFTLKVTPDIASRLVGRFIINNNNKIEPFDASIHTNQIIRLRSPMYCRTTSICRTCYGRLLERNKTRYVGVLAGQILGERLSQSIMRQFHVGGEIKMKECDLYKELTNSLDEQLIPLFKNHFSIEKNNLVSNVKVSGKVVISKDYYHDKKDLIETPKTIHLSYGYFTIQNETYNVDVAIDNKIEISLENKTVYQDEKTITVEFSEKQVIFTAVPTPEIFSKQVKIIDAMFSGKQPYKNADHFCTKVYSTYMNLKSDADMVHFEVLASNLLRDSKNSSYPARLNPNEYKFVILSLNSIPKYESWLQAFAFQDPKDAITTGLLYPRQEKETVIEKLISGNF